MGVVLWIDSLTRKKWPGRKTSNLKDTL